MQSPACCIEVFFRCNRRDIFDSMWVAEQALAGRFVYYQYYDYTGVQWYCNWGEMLDTGWFFGIKVAAQVAAFDCSKWDNSFETGQVVRTAVVTSSESRFNGSNDEQGSPVGR